MTALAHHQALLAAGAGDLTTWNPAHLSPNATLAAANRELRATNNTPYANSRSLSPLEGLVYFSGQCTKNGSNNYGFGVADAAAALTTQTNYAGAGNSIGWWHEGRVYMNGRALNNSAGVPNGNIQVAVRVAQRRVWIRHNGGSWIGGGDPVANTTPTGTLGGTGALYIAGSIDPAGTANGVVTLPATVAQVTGTPPAGFQVGVF